MECELCLSRAGQSFLWRTVTFFKGWTSDLQDNITIITSDLHDNNSAINFIYINKINGRIDPMENINAFDHKMQYSCLEIVIFKVNDSSVIYLCRRKHCLCIIQLDILCNTEYLIK